MIPVGAWWTSSSRACPPGCMVDDGEPGLPKLLSGSSFLVVALCAREGVPVFSPLLTSGVRSSRLGSRSHLTWVAPADPIGAAGRGIRRFVAQGERRVSRPHRATGPTRVSI